MTQAVSNYDVVVVGASVAGCTAAILFARQGLTVALVERNHDINHYSKLCTHYIQASARPVIKRLGLLEPIKAAGGLDSGSHIWSRRGWIQPLPTENSSPIGLNIRREKLDPMLRYMAAETPGLTMMLGFAANELLVEDGRFTGLVAQNNQAKQKITIKARLLVAADGHYSKMGELSGVPTRKWPNNRFAYMAYFKDLPIASGDNAQIWFQEPDVAYAFPTDDGLTLLTAGPTIDKLEAFKRDISGSFYRFWQDVPGGPVLCREKQVSEIRGMVKGHIVQRRPTLPGLAFIGDAALSSDPVWGVGLGWAFQSAGWLVDETAAALKEDGRLDKALGRYRRRHRLSLTSHHWHITSYANGRDFIIFEKLYFAAAALDEKMAAHFHAYGARQIGFFKLGAPHWLLYALYVLLMKRK